MRYCRYGEGNCVRYCRKLFVDEDGDCGEEDRDGDGGDWGSGWEWEILGIRMVEIWTVEMGIVGNRFWGWYGNGDGDSSHH